MNENTKRIIITIGIILILCCFVTLMASVVIYGLSKEVDKRINVGPQDAQQVRENIATFDLPPDYELAAGMSIFFYDMVSLLPEKNGYLPSIMLVQYSGFTVGDNEKMEEELRNAAQQQGGQPGISVPIVGEFETVIRGEVTTVTVSEDTKMRQWTAVFEGNLGPTLFMAQGHISGWDEQLLMDFLASIR
ncbi:MAG TPA: hypothetical protein DIW23_10740 [Anaerolineae bacterium]|nr:hypothetical protein [Anaerolineae bacterium]